MAVLHEKTGLLYADATVSYMDVNNLCIAQPTAKTQYRKFETNIPRKGTARPQSQFPHSCVCERFIFFLYCFIYLKQGNE